MCFKHFHLSCMLNLSLIEIFTRDASLTMTKYLEEFPGLVHFLYIDRTNHRITTPTLNFTSDETNDLTRRKVNYFSIYARIYPVRYRTLILDCQLNYLLYCFHILNF